MRKVAVLTDSASDIPEELREKYGIDIMSFTITLDGQSYVERQDFTNEEFYDMLRNAEGMPSTAHITMLQFYDQYCAYLQAGYTDVVHITINAGGSATFDAATMAARQLAEEHPESKMKIHLVDSHTYSMPYGYFVCEAARKLHNGAEIKHVISDLEADFATVEIAVSVFSLKFIKKSGRVSAAAAFAGELLGLRPIITINDGVTAVVNKVRGDKNVLPALLAHAKNHREGEREYLIGTTDMKTAEELGKLCKKEFGMPPACIFMLGAAVASNTGPDAIAIVYHGAKRR
ncbi:MAG: DegV family protein [Oscillospiraceae bacterium]|nr:DegV family protein [Oscillospiraceae bacterium]